MVYYMTALDVHLLIEVEVETGINEIFEVVETQQIRNKTIRNRHSGS